MRAPGEAAAFQRMSTALTGCPTPPLWRANASSLLPLLFACPLSGVPSMSSFLRQLVAYPSRAADRCCCSARSARSMVLTPSLTRLWARWCHGLGPTTFYAQNVPSQAPKGRSDRWRVILAGCTRPLADSARRGLTELSILLSENHSRPKEV